MIGDRYEIKTADLASIMAQSYTFRYLELIADNKQKAQLHEIEKVCELAHKTFGIPQSPEDSFQIQDFVYNKMQEKLKNE